MLVKNVQSVQLIMSRNCISSRAPQKMVKMICGPNSMYNKLLKNITNDVGQHILVEISNSGSFLPTDGPELDKILKTFFFMPHFHPIAD